MVKSEVQVAPKAEVSYPRLEVYPPTGIVVLKTAPRIGTIVGYVVAEHKSKYTVGDHREDWGTGAFVPFTGSVTLSNSGE